MKLMLIVDDFQNGAGNVAQLLALEWVRQGKQVSLLLTDCNSQPRYQLDKISLLYLDFKQIKGNPAFRLYQMITGMGRRIEEGGRPDLVISFLDYNNTIAGLALWNKKIPLIASERNNVLDLIPTRPWKLLRRLAYYRADLITVQFAAFRTFDGGRFVGKCRVTPNMIKAPAAVKEQWEKDRVSFVVMGRLIKRKRIDFMIDMFAEAAVHMKGAQLNIWGQGPEEENLKRIVSERNLERIVFVDGYTGQVHEELLKHDVYLMTSILEGFPNSLSEAQAVGLPAVAMECHEGIREIIEDGESGFVVPISERQQFVEKMILLAGDRPLRIRMGRRAQEIVNRYSKEKILDIWEECMNEADRK